jgi:hypothetical protein
MRGGYERSVIGPLMVADFGPLDFAPVPIQRHVETMIEFDDALGFPFELVLVLISQLGCLFGAPGFHNGNVVGIRVHAPKDLKGPRREDSRSSA